MNSFKKYWGELQPRERLILSWGGFIVAIILLYALLLQPLYRAVSFMESSLPGLRSNLVWMQQTDQLLEDGGGVIAQKGFDGAGESLLSVIESTARRAKLSKSIQQMVPGKDNAEVRVILEDANFNQWLQWVDILYKQSGVDIRQVTAERDDDKPNIAEIRVTFIRSN